MGNSPLTATSGGYVGIRTANPQELLDLTGAGANEGVGKGIRLGSYWELGSTAYYADAYFGINAVLTTSDTQNGTNAFSPIYSGGQGMVMSEEGGGSGNIDFYGINWNGNSTGQSFPSAFTPVMALHYNGSVGIGTTNPGAALEVNGNVKLTANSGASITFQDGTTQSTAYTGVACGGDFAESVNVTGDRHSYEPGDLLVIDPKSPGKFLRAAQPYSTLVAGVYSTRPGYVGRRLSGAKSPDEVPLAMVGIVPVKVTAENGPIQTGDLLVASSIPGRAMKGTDRSRLTGAVVGKALGGLDSGTGTIEVLVTLQ
uniref:Uncharacterized protein n=1 Tax=Paracidobacterium acidisoli TaxID=2303751 RepID=A0A372IJY7_9BACT